MIKQENPNTNDDSVQFENIDKESKNEEIDLVQLWKVVWTGKWIISVTTIIFAGFSVIYALGLPNIFKAQVLLAPAISEQSSGLSGLSGQVGGLASLAGIKLGSSQANTTTLALEILKSRDFTARFIEKRKILPQLMAVSNWNATTNTLEYNDTIYLGDSGEWVRKVAPPRNSKPSMQEAHIVFRSKLAINQKEDTGMVTLSIDHHSPFVAKEWVDWLVEDINIEMKLRDKKEAERSIEYLKSQIQTTTVLEHKTLLFQLIEDQAKTLMFAEVRDEYVFKTIDPAVVPELRFKPKRSFIVFLAVFLGTFVGLIIVFVRYLFHK